MFSFVVVRILRRARQRPAVKYFQIFKYSFSLLLILFLSGCYWKDNGEYLYIISKLHSNQENKISIPEPKLQLALAHAVEHSELSTLKVLNAQTNDELELSEVKLGLEVEAEAGIHNVVELSGSAAIELEFEPLPYPEKN